MKPISKYLIATTAGCLLSAGAHAYDVTATVSNTITLTETTPLSLGSVFIRKGLDADGTTDSTPAFIVLSPTTGDVTETAATADGDAGDTISKFVSLGGAQAGVLSVSGAQAFGEVTITHDPTTPTTNLTHESGNPSIPVIQFTTLTTSPADAATLTLDGTGAGDILVGGTFTAVEAATAGTAYQDGVYTGTYSLTVSY